MREGGQGFFKFLKVGKPWPLRDKKFYTACHTYLIFKPIVQVV
jgi:hypothetical protein